MKANKEDVRALKSKHRIESVMQEHGEKFALDASNLDKWNSTSTPGLTVDIRRQTFEHVRPGMEVQTGDVLTWLQGRLSFSFGMVITYLKKRTPDPKRETIPVQAKKQKQVQLQENDFVTITHEYKDPVTGARSCGYRFNYEKMDNLQQRALDAAGDWVIKYFTKTSRELFDKMQDYPSRFQMTIDFDVTKCARCESPFEWRNPDVVAWALEEKKCLDVVSDDDSAEYMTTEEEIFIDADFVICDKCLRSEYAPRYKALRLAYQSARKREEREDAEQRQRDRADWLIAEREREREEEHGIYEAYP